MARIAAAVLTAWAMTTTAHAAFRDPLDAAASMTPLAAITRLTAVTRTGDRLVAVGPAGRIVLSKDDGKSWVQVPVPVSSDLTAVRFASPLIGWAVGNDGVVLNTRDGGSTWNKQLDGKLAAAADLAKSQELPDQSSDATRKLVDAAKRAVDEGPDKPFFDVLFLNEHEGFAVGAFNLAVRTRDGGKTWESLGERTANPDGYHLYSLTASQEGVFLAGEHGLLRRWNAELERFEELPSPYKGSYFGIVGQGSGLFVFGMRGNAFRSHDSGRTWEKLDTHGAASINGGVALSDKCIVLATQGGALLVSTDHGATFELRPSQRPQPYAAVAPVTESSVAVVGPFGVRVEAVR